MRSLFLASAAVIVSAGLACAQTTPAPTGAPNAPVVTQPGASPGNTAPATSGMSSGGMGTGQTTATPSNSSGSSGTATTPPATNSGAMSSPAPNMSPAAAAPSSTTTTTTSSTMAPKHHWKKSASGMGSGGMSAHSGPTAYLHSAQTAIAQKNKAAADNDLSMAETRLLNGVVPAGSTAVDTSPAVSSIEDARKAVAAGDFQAAAHSTDMALQQSAKYKSMAQ